LKYHLFPERRLRRIWEKARSSIGYEAEEAVGFKASLMVDGLRQTRKALKVVEASIEQVCRRLLQRSTSPWLTREKAMTRAIVHL
jgi:hypothetical protein